MRVLAHLLEQTGIGSSSLTIAYQTRTETAYRMTARGGTEAIAIWQKLRDLVPKSGHWPVLLGSKTIEFARQLEDRDRILRKGAAINPTAWLEERQRELVETLSEDFRASFGDFERSAETPEFAERKRQLLNQEEPFQGIPRGKWPENAQASDSFTIPFDLLTHEALAAVNIGLIPTRNSWEVPAYVRFGGCNECPHPHEHSAIMKYWEERYGAEVVGITSDVIEMLVARPPRNRSDALDLAREQYLYCSDIVDQGTDTLEALAAVLLRGTVWFFWWD